MSHRLFDKPLHDLFCHLQPPDKQGFLIFPPEKPLTTELTPLTSSKAASIHQKQPPPIVICFSMLCDIDKLLIVINVKIKKNLIFKSYKKSRSHVNVNYSFFDYGLYY